MQSSSSASNSDDFPFFGILYWSSGTKVTLQWFKGRTIFDWRKSRKSIIGNTYSLSREILLRFCINSLRFRFEFIPSLASNKEGCVHFALHVFFPDCRATERESLVSRFLQSIFLAKMHPPQTIFWPHDPD